MHVSSSVCVFPGNAGFETANHLVGNAAYIHMASRYIYK